MEFLLQGFTIMSIADSIFHSEAAVFTIIRNHLIRIKDVEQILHWHNLVSVGITNRSQLLITKRKEAVYIQFF